MRRRPVARRRGVSAPEADLRPVDLGKAMKGRCEWHKPSGVAYTAWHADAERRANKGEKQRRCRTCKYYLWPDEFGVKP